MLKINMHTTEIYIRFLVNVTLEKPPWGKPVEDEIYYRALREILQQINEHEELDLQQPNDLKLGS